MLLDRADPLADHRANHWVDQGGVVGVLVDAGNCWTGRARPGVVERWWMLVTAGPGRARPGVVRAVVELVLLGQADYQTD